MIATCLNEHGNKTPLIANCLCSNESLKR